MGDDQGVAVKVKHVTDPGFQKSLLALEGGRGPDPDLIMVRIIFKAEPAGQDLALMGLRADRSGIAVPGDHFHTQDGPAGPKLQQSVPKERRLIGKGEL